MQRITITVPDEVITRVRERVAAGDATSVSAFFAEAADEKAGPSKNGIDVWLDGLDEQYGPVPDETQEWANRIIRGEIDG